MKNSLVQLKPWKTSDAKFIIKLRNNPKLMRWFRQTEPITLEEQVKFMESDQGWDYNGKIIYLKGKKVGVGAVKNSGELSLVLPDKYKEYRRVIIAELIKGYTHIWGEVFTNNPISWDLEILGFKPVHTLYKYESPNKFSR